MMNSSSASHCIRYKYGRACLLCVFVALSLAVAVPPSLAQNTTTKSGWVVIPVAEYRALHAKAYPPAREPEPPPVDATLTRVDYDLQINGDLAEGRASITVDVLKDGWVRVPVPTGLLVRGAKLDGRLVSLVPGNSGKGTSQLSALLSRSGRSVLLLDVALPVTANAGEESITLPSTESGVTRAAVQLGRQGVELKLSGGLLANKSESATATKWLAYAGGNEPLTFTWTRKTEDHRSTLPLRLRGSLTELAGLGEDTDTIVAEANLEVVQGAAKEARISLPDKVVVNQVAGATVADWEMQAGQLVVTFLEPVEHNAKFIVKAESRSQRDGEIAIPILRLLGTERDTGGVAVEVLGAGEIKEFKTEGLENSDASDLGEIVADRQSTSLAAFRFRAGDAKSQRSLTVNVARYTPEAVLMANIAEARYNVLVTNDGKTLVEARYAIRNNERNFLKVALPAGAILWSAELEGRAVRPGQSPDGGILLPLEKSHAGEDAPEFAAEIVYISRGSAWNDKGQFQLALPTLDLPVSRTGLLIFHPPFFRVSPEAGAFRIESYEQPASAALNPPPPAPMMISTDSVGAAAVPQPSSSATVLSLPRSIAPADAKQASAQNALNHFRMALQGGKAAGIMPIEISFPALGPSLYLVSELTAENHGANVAFNYQHEKKAGGR
ncbi:MAG TPA: hypothetical protein VJN93_07720 [Candidatus Acidoferrum sp.]|nr:hypothetical protein [Candidatus Acidoferrum sp.]